MNKKIKYFIWLFFFIYIMYLSVHGVDKNSAIFNLIHIFSSENNFLLLLYAVFFIIVFVFYQQHKKRFDTGSFLYLIYVMGGVGACWYYAQDKVDLYYPNIQIAPLFYLFVTINICLLPLWNAKFSSLQRIKDNGMAEIYDGLSFVFFALSILPLVSLLSNFSVQQLVGSNLSNMYEYSGDKSALFFSGPSKFCFAMIRRFEVLVVVLLFYQLSKRKTKYVYELCIPIMVFTLFKLLSGSRGGLVGTGLLMVTLFLMLRQTFSAETRKTVVKIGAVVGSLFVLALAAISISRFSQNTNTEDTIDVWISQYMGEAIPRFSDDAWGIKTLLYGNQNFMFLRKLIGLSYIENYDSYKTMYGIKLGTPVDVFYTFMGDIYLDFGTIGGLVFSIIFAFIFSKFLKIKNDISIPTLAVLCLFFDLLGFGFTANVYRTIFIQQDMVWLIIAIVILYMVQLVRQQNKNTPHLGNNM
jgi:oligosaccharide repeat unit polymerase